MNGKTALLAVLTFLLVGFTSPFLAIGLPLAILAALVMGAIAGWWATKSEGQHAGRRATVAIAVAALLGSIVAMSVLAFVVVNLPGVPAYIQASEPNPEARIPYNLMNGLAGGAGLLTGLALGLLDVIAALAGGLVASSLTAHGSRATA